jgi:hypothetical protein
MIFSEHHGPFGWGLYHCPDRAEPGGLPTMKTFSQPEAPGTIRFLYGIYGLAALYGTFCILRQELAVRSRMQSRYYVFQ